MNIPIGAAEAEVLSQVACPVSIRFAEFGVSPDPRWDHGAVSRIPTLTSFSTYRQVSDAVAATLGSHPNLTALRIGSTQSQAGMVALASSQKLASLEISYPARAALSADFFSALAANKTMTSLPLDFLGLVFIPASLVETLSRNTQLTALHIMVSGSESLRHLAVMPALKNLLLRVDYTTPIADVDVKALSEKPLDSLAFRCIGFSPSALAIAASSKASRLVFSFCGLINHEAIQALLENKSVSSLRIEDSSIVEGGAARLAAHPRIHSFEWIDLLKHEERSKIQEAWVAAGKPLINLTVGS